MKTISKRRRIEGRTDYHARLVLLKSGKPRIVFRKTNRYIIAQIVSSKGAQDEVISGLDSRALVKYGWPKSYSIKSLPASYLLGFLLGKKAIEKFGKLEAILDLGLLRSIAKSKEYAFLKGVADSGVSISCNEKMFPSEERISGKHLSKGIDFKKIKEKITND